MRCKIISIVLCCCCMFLIAVIDMQKEEIEVLANPDTLTFDVTARGCPSNYMRIIEQDTRLHSLYLTNIGFKDLDHLAALDKPLMQVVIETDSLFMSREALEYLASRVQSLYIYADDFKYIGSAEPLSDCRILDLIIHAPIVHGAEAFLQIESLENLVIESTATINVSKMNLPNLLEADFLGGSIIGLDQVQMDRSKIKTFL